MNLSIAAHPIWVDRSWADSPQFMNVVFVRFSLQSVLVISLLSASGTSAATFTVDSILDNSDNNAGDGICNDGGGNCTLRAAIEEANALSGTDNIHFSIAGGGPHTFTPGSAFPTITDPVIIDGTTEPDYTTTPVVELNGTSAGASSGLLITAGSSTVKGLAINRFGANGIYLHTNGNNVIQSNYVGTDVTGTVDLGNTADGIQTNSGATGNTIGGSSAGAGNVISGNNNIGINILTSSNTIQGNRIGTNAAGTAILGNTNDGIRINNVPDNTIGGTAAGSRNLISGNGLYGIFIIGTSASGNTILGNYIGTDVNGTADLGNTNEGVHIRDASNNTVGGTTAAARNIISGNNSYGVGIFTFGATPTGNIVAGNYIGTDVNGTAAIGNSQSGVSITGANNTVGGTTAGAGNLISGNSQEGVEITTSDATGNKVEGNYIGTDISGTVDLGNGLDGVYISVGANNTIGGTDSGAGNLISGNDNDGIEIRSSGADENTVLGNLIGTNANGTVALGNAFVGLKILNGAQDNVVGGTASGARNIISGNGTGVQIFGSSTTGNSLVGNYIGTNASGTAAVGNNTGVLIQDTPNNTVGGSTAAARNVIAGNTANGIRVFQSNASGNKIQGNYIGTDASGNAALANANYGIQIEDAPSNTIGGVNAGEGNVISGNTFGGIAIVLANSTGNVIQGNLIGTNAGGTSALGNGLQGVYVFVSAGADNTIGGTTTGAANTIANNGDDGVRIDGSTGHAILGNSIHSNTGLGIDLQGANGVDANDVVKAHFQLKQSQARVNVSARHRELFNTELGLYGLPEHRQMTVTFDPTQTWFDVEQCRGYPTVAL